MKRSTLITLGIVAVLGFWIFTGYNGLITQQQNVEAAWADVQTQYQRRVDLIPNLVSTVKGAADFEQETFIEVTQARTQWQSAGTRSEQVAAANQMEQSLGRLLLTVENYPQLQATQAFRDLMTQLEGTENRIATSRKYYNDAVRVYNLRVKRIPGALIAMLFGFDEEPFFEAEQGSDQAPDVEF